MSWFRNPVNIGIAVGAAILAVVVVVLIVWGVTHHTEGGILQVCWGPEGEAQYVEGAEQDHGACPGAEELVWSTTQIPLTLAPLAADGTPLAEDAPEQRVLAYVITDLNAQLAFELFRVGFSPQTPDAEVRFGGAFAADVTNPPPGYVRHRRLDGTVLWGEVGIRSDVAAVDRLLYLVLAHELLHLAGLQHDDFPASIMYPLTREDWADDRVNTAHITDVDVNLLQSRYLYTNAP